MSATVRELRREIATADAALTANPDDIEAKKARIAATGALAAATAGRVERRRIKFLRELETRTKGEDGAICSCGADWSLPLDQHKVPGPYFGEHRRIDGDLRDIWWPLTWGERIRLMPVVMDVWFLATYYTGLRDRMRCPRCTAIGTWKMHGTWWERWRFGDIALRRWGCKYCGHWIAKGAPNGQIYNGRIVAFPLSQEGLKVWAYPDPSIEREPTPAEVVHAGMGRTWPWYG